MSVCWSVGLRAVTDVIHSRDIGSVQRWKLVSGSWVTALDPLTHDHKISAQYLAYFVLS